MIFDRHANLKYKYGSRHFWSRWYYVDTVGRNKRAIEEYIKKSVRRKYSSGSDINQRIYRPVYRQHE